MRKGVFPQRSLPAHQVSTWFHFRSIIQVTYLLFLQLPSRNVHVKTNSSKACPIAARSWLSSLMNSSKNSFSKATSAGWPSHRVSLSRTDRFLLPKPVRVYRATDEWYVNRLTQLGFSKNANGDPS